MRALVTGASGLLGTWLLRTAPQGADAIAATLRSQIDWPQQAQADLRDAKRTRCLVETSAPDIVVHAAYARDFDSIVTVTANVAEAARAAGTHVLMVSTDAVFTGDGTPRSEEDEPDPVWDYGRWKKAAEGAVLRTDPDSTIVRSPLLVSLDPPDRMVRRISEAASRGDGVGWYARERHQPAYAADVARALWEIGHLPPRERRGIWHLPGPEVLTRRELGTRIARALHVDDPGTEIQPNEIRPRALVLAGDRARTQIRWRPDRVLTHASL